MWEGCELNLQLSLRNKHTRIPYSPHLQVSPTPPHWISERLMLVFILKMGRWRRCLEYRAVGRGVSVDYRSVYSKCWRTESRHTKSLVNLEEEKSFVQLETFSPLI
jgi:hypothetical protein